VRLKYRLFQESLSAPGLDEEEKAKMLEEIKTLNEDIELRSTQILDLTHKLQSLDSYQGKIWFTILQHVFQIT
jgi:hypothetical protein